MEQKRAVNLILFSDIYYRGFLRRHVIFTHKVDVVHGIAVGLGVRRLEQVGVVAHFRPGRLLVRGCRRYPVDESLEDRRCIRDVRRVGHTNRTHKPVVSHIHVSSRTLGLLSSASGAQFATM
jgi:hypothetical protein